MDEITIKMSPAMAETAALVLSANGCSRAARRIIAALRNAEPDESHVRRLCEGADAGKLDRMIEDAEAAPR